MDRGSKFKTMKSPTSKIPPTSSSFRDQPRRKSTSNVRDSNPPPLPSRKLSDLPPLNQNVTVGAPPPPPTRNAPSLRPKVNSPREDVPALPVRDRSSWTPPNDLFEERFKFHKVSELPPPEAFKLEKKSYPSSLVKKVHKKPPSPPPPPPDQAERLEAPPPRLRNESSRPPPSRDDSPPPPPLPRRKSTTDHSIFSKDSSLKTKM